MRLIICLARFSSIALALLAGATHVRAAAPTTQPASAVKGTVNAESEVPLSEMVVFLESPDPKRPMPPPSTQPVKVSQKGAQFQPKLTVVTIGETVEFPNSEDKPIEHNVFSNSPAKRFDLGLYGPGKSKSMTFDKPGAVMLYCSIHRYMDGVVYVAPTPYTSLVDKDGRYEIKNVPPGKWTVKTWQRRRRFPEQTVPVDVQVGKPATVDLELKRK
jgi:plastocyanin